MIQNVKLAFNTQIYKWDELVLADRRNRIGPMRRFIEILMTKMFRIDFLSLTDDLLPHFNRIYPKILEQFEFIACRPNRIESINILMKWLNSGTNDNVQKVLKLKFAYGIPQEDAGFIRRIQRVN